MNEVCELLQTRRGVWLAAVLWVDPGVVAVVVTRGDIGFMNGC